MDIIKLNKANILQNKICNLESVLNDFNGGNDYEGFCTWSSKTKYHSAYGHIIKDSVLCKEIKQLIRDKLSKYKEEFEQI